MTPDKIQSVLLVYKIYLEKAGVPKERMNPKKYFSWIPWISRRQHLKHAHYLIDGALEFARDPDKQDKANRHLTAVQMCLWEARWFVLADLMSHNWNHNRQ